MRPPMGEGEDKGICQNLSLMAFSIKEGKEMRKNPDEGKEMRKKTEKELMG